MYSENYIFPINVLQCFVGIKSLFSKVVRTCISNVILKTNVFACLQIQINFKRYEFEAEIHFNSKFCLYIEDSKYSTLFSAPRIIYTPNKIKKINVIIII